MVKENFKYVSPLNSKEMNEAHNEALYEIEKVCSYLNKTIEEQNEFHYIDSIDRKYLEIAINDMYRKFDKTSDSLTYRASDIIASKNANINVEKQFISKKSEKTLNKLTLRNSDNSIFIPDDLIIEAVSDEKYISISDNDVFNIVKDNKKPWVREIVTNDNVDKVYTTIYIYIPYSISSNDLVNEISFSTFPFNTTEVAEIQYSTDYNINKMLSLDEIRYHKGHVINDYCIGCNKTKNHIILNFDDINAKVIAITLKQDKCIQNDSNKKFYLGLKDLKILHKEYIDNNLEFAFDFIPPSPEGVYIESIQFEYNNSYNFEPITSIYEINGDKEKLLYSEFNDFNTTHKTIRFKVKYPITSSVPNINKIKIFYKI